MKAILRLARISPKKANLVAGMVRGKKVKDALEILEYTPKKAAKLLYKVVRSAAANATNNFKQNLDELVITRILVTKGPTLKRSIPVSRGRSHPILKRCAHITVDVGVPGGVSSPEKTVTVPAVETTEKPAKKSSAKKDASPKAPRAKKSPVKSSAKKTASKK